MNVRKICKNGSTKFITIPQEWGKIDEFVNVEIINENELRITKVFPLKNELGVVLNEQ